MRTLAILLALSTVAHAAFVPKEPQNAEGIWECIVTSITPKDNDRYPARKGTVTISRDQQGRVSIGVIWMRSNGQEVDRSRQYTRNITLWQYQDGSVRWQGQIGDRPGNWFMYGTFDPNEQTYTETVQNTVIRSSCYRQRW